MSVLLDYDDDDDEDSTDENLQPIHFRECLRLLDAALTASNPPILPRWCHSEHLGAIEDPVLMINGYRRSLSLPMNKQEARRMIRKAEPLPMKIDLIEGVSVSPPLKRDEVGLSSLSLLSSFLHLLINYRLNRFVFRIRNGNPTLNPI